MRPSRSCVPLVILAGLQVFAQRFRGEEAKDSDQPASQRTFRFVCSCVETQYSVLTISFVMVGWGRFDELAIGE